MTEANFVESLRNFKATRAPSPSSSASTLKNPNASLWNKLLPTTYFGKPAAGGTDIESQQTLLPRFFTRSSNAAQQRACCRTLSTTQGASDGRIKRLIAFACLFAGGALCFTVSFFMLPMLVVSPHKFAVLSCMGSLMLFSSIGFLRGWTGHLQAVFNRDRWPFTLLYVGSFIGGLIRKYFLTLLCILLHTLALVWYLISFLPGGTAGLRSMSTFVFGNARSFLGT